MDLCLSKLDCVAIDVWSDACSLHMNASDLLSSRSTSGVLQFVLDRSCAVSTASATSLTTVFSSALMAGYYRIFCIVFVTVGMCRLCSSRALHSICAC